MRLWNMLLILSIIGFTFYLFLPVLKPFLIGAFFAIAAQKPARIMQKKLSISEQTAVFFALCSVASLFLFILLIIGFVGARTAAHLTSVIPKYKDIIVLNIEETIQTISAALSDQQKENVIFFIETMSDSAVTIAGQYAESWLLSGTAFFLRIPGAASEIIVAVLSAFFIARDGRRIIRLIPALVHERILLAISYFVTAVQSFMTAQIILFIITFAAASGGFFLLRYPHAIEVAFLAAIADLIPLLGSSLLFIPWMAFSALTGQYMAAILLAILYVVLVIMRQLLEPKLVSGAIGLHPLAVLFSAFAGLTFFGAAGMVSGPLLLLACQSIYRSGLTQLLFIKR
ncbi:AI-2E family transporter [Domibacillus epiphyticus]|uniref:Sporulation integral membrane protein YtvI n=1 Tax=Domibacillus epiphyticus TaxID=1714355 RepID=A0A1V2A8X9_9BACI|nr:AI-2E family transporter [Domibacillus epiphyticus]OMP67465.1 hypothetical protein BTO28_05835 [Domibacillus epiphyticus]